MDFPEGIIKAAKNAQEIKIEEGSVAWRVGGAFSQCLELQGEGRRQGSETREEKKKEKLGLLWEMGPWFPTWKCLHVISISIGLVAVWGRILYLQLL